MSHPALVFVQRLAVPVAALVALASALFLSSTSNAYAQSADEVKAEFARAVYRSSATQVHDERPQPLLRAVVVLRVKLDEGNRWQAEVFRDNPSQPEMTRAALDSVARLPSPVGLSQTEAQQLRDDGLIEAWLF